MIGRWLAPLVALTSCADEMPAKVEPELGVRPPSASLSIESSGLPGAKTTLRW